MNTGIDTRVVTIVGILCIAIGLVLNEWILTALFSTDGTLIGSSRLVVWVFDGVAILLGTLLLVFRQRLAPYIQIPSREKLILLAVGSLVGLIMLEGGLRFWLYRYASERAYGRYATYGMIQKKNLRYSPHPYLSFYTTPNYRNNDGDQHNSLGFRGEEIELPKPPGRYRIVALGGSTTYESEVPTYKQSYPYLLQQELHARGLNFVDVVNAGVGSYDSWSSLINLQFRVLDLDPDLIIYYEGSNEARTRLVYPYSAYRGDNTGRIQSAPLPNTRLIDKLVTTRILLDRLGITAPYADIARINDADTLVSELYLDQLKNNTYPSGIFKEHSAMEIFQHNPPIYTERNIRNMIAISKAQEIDVALVSFAYEPITIRTSSDIYQEAIRQYNELIKEIAADTKITYFDFVAVMPHDSRYWIRDGVHANEEGTVIKAKLFADFLTSHIPALRIQK